ncbi:MAG: lipoprotein [Candidatus Cryptobacteroides sp.]
MKKILIYASAALLLAGCAKENIDIDAPYVTFSGV